MIRVICLVWALIILSVLELAKFDLEVARGAYVRSRVRWVEEGESSSAFFFRLERKRGVDRRISALRLRRE